MPLTPSELEDARKVDLSPPPDVRTSTRSLIGRVRLLWPWPKQNQSWDAEFRRKLSRNTHKKNWAKARRIAIEFAAEAEKRQNYWVMFDAAWSLMRLEV